MGTKIDGLFQSESKMDEAPHIWQKWGKKNEALAKVVRLQVMMMRYNRSKQGASASKQDDMHMANLIKQEEHEKRMRTVRSKGNV